jgi:hypothetical protein
VGRGEAGALAAEPRLRSVVTTSEADVDALDMPAREAGLVHVSSCVANGGRRALHGARTAGELVGKAAAEESGAPRGSCRLGMIWMSISVSTST